MVNTMKYSQKSRKPRLGQHFLTSQGALLDMVESGDIHRGETIIEIGPGKGILTEKLIEQARLVGGKVLAIEKDEELIVLLREKFAADISEGVLTLNEGDILDIQIEKVLKPDENYKIVANIPYYITGEIIRLFLTQSHKPQSMTLLVQKEVAERIVARDGKESILSLSVKIFGVPRYVSTVKKGSFNPPPNVDSAIIHIDDIHSYEQEEAFFALVKAGFQSKRKKLISNISDLYAKEKLVETFKKLNVDENTRAEDLKLEQWMTLLTELV